jgi:DinB superfamily
MEKNQQDLFIKTVLHNWDVTIKRASKAFDAFTDVELSLEVAPGKNRVVYLLGHLTATHDRMFTLQGLGERLYPHFDELFLTNPDKTGLELPPVHEMRSYWTKINELMTERLQALRPEEWLQRHTAVSEEDFVKEPHRNRLSVVLSRTGHVSYHAGQLALLKK